MRAFINLTKPRITILFALTGASALLLEGSLSGTSLAFWTILVALYFVGGSANAFNQYLERDLDSQMERTAKRRPLPLKEITPFSALIFSIVMGVLGLILLWFWGGALAMALGLFTIIFYSFFYTLWLKPRTPYNIVVGGVAGAMGPLIAWAAVAGTIGWEAWVMFLIIFMWTPPHFWALAIYYKKDYEKISMPMLPVVKGDEFTRKQILGYSLTLLPISLFLLKSPQMGWFYAAFAIVGGLYFIWKAFELDNQKTPKLAYRLFGMSIFYLLVLFVVIIVDATVV